VIINGKLEVELVALNPALSVEEQAKAVKDCINESMKKVQTVVAQKCREWAVLEYNHMDIQHLIVGPLRTNCYLLADGPDLAIIDPGGDAAAIEQAIQKLSASPKYIINTHGHFDHVGANLQLKEKYRVPVAAGINELPSPGFYPEIILRGGQDIKIGGVLLKVMETPGHTPGGICFLGSDFVISGDTLFEDSIGRTDLPGGSDIDMVRSLKKLDRAVASGATVYPGHGNIFKYKKGMVDGWVDYLNK